MEGGAAGGCDGPANALAVVAVQVYVTDSPDAVLVQLARGGDPQAFDVLVRRHLRAAFAVALAVVRDRADAEDVCQDAFLTALEHIEDCRQPERFRAWMLQITRNRARNFVARRKVRRAVPLEVADRGGDDDPARDLERAELGERLLAALAVLPEVQREIVLLHELDGWRHQDIAAALGISVAMSRVHLFNARRTLRRQLGAETYQECRHAR